MHRAMISAALFLASTVAVVVWALPHEPKERTIQCQLRDGSVLQLEPTQAEFVLATKYGTFHVPLSDIATLEPALPRSAELEREIQQWMTDLGSPQFAVREKAQAALQDKAEYAYPHLKAGLKADLAEVAKRCETILQSVDRKVNDQTYQDRSLDIITTKDVTVLRGKLETTSIKVRTKSLGELTIQLADVKCLGEPVVKEDKKPLRPIINPGSKIEVGLPAMKK